MASSESNGFSVLDSGHRVKSFGTESLFALDFRLTPLPSLDIKSPEVIEITSTFPATSHYEFTDQCCCMVCPLIWLSHTILPNFIALNEAFI